MIKSTLSEQIFFVSLEKNSQHALSGTIEGVKRDKQVIAVAGLFILILLYDWKKTRFLFNYQLTY